MPNTYNKTAKEIIKNSIRSAIFVDDKLAVPFKANQNALDVQLSRALYNSFTQNNVGIDFYRYDARKDWKQSKDFIFKGRDLLVLDWQLDNDEYEKNTLEILQDAINTKSLHFVCIYTSKRPDEFPDIAYAIKAFFSNYDDSLINEPTAEVVEFLDNELSNGLSGETRSLCEDFLKQYSLHHPKNKQEKFDRLKQNIISAIGEVSTNLLQRELRTKFKSNTESAFEAFGFGLNEVYLSRANPSQYSINFFLEEGFIVIENTIIIITNKNNPRPSLLYSFFTEALLKSAGNFLSLLSLDLKNILRDSSGFIGKELDKIEETAFFYHKDNIEPKEAFFDFVLELWKSNLASLLYSQNDLIKLFNEETLINYRKAKKIDTKINRFKKKGNKSIDYDLAKLNYYYNSLENRNLEDFVRFGDIFNILDDRGNSTSEYLLCITAHCDCLHIENIRNLLFFVRGAITENAKGLAEGDAGNNSFILDKDLNVICIKWSNKPFTIYLGNNRILSGTHDVHVGRSLKHIHYVSTLKENYCQRIANNAFSHPMRVGIFFAKKQ